MLDGRCEVREDCIWGVESGVHIAVLVVNLRTALGTPSVGIGHGYTSCSRNVNFGCIAATQS